MLSGYRATAAETRLPLIGDDILPEPDVTVDSAFTINIGTEVLWAWIVQLGKGRAGWYYPYWFERFMWVAERFLPQRWRGHWRGLRVIDDTLQHPAVGSTMADWSRATMTVWAIQPERHLVYEAVTPNGKRFSWTLVFTPTDAGTRLHSRTRVHPVKYRRLWRFIGPMADRLFAAGLAQGLRDRLSH